MSPCSRRTRPSRMLSSGESNTVALRAAGQVDGERSSWSWR